MNRAYICRFFSEDATKNVLWLYLEEASRLSERISIHNDLPHDERGLVCTVQATDPKYRHSKHDDGNAQTGSTSRRGSRNGSS